MSTSTSAPCRARRSFDEHVDERSLSRVTAEVHRGVPTCTAAHERVVGSTGTLDEHLLDPPDPFRVAAGGASLDDFDEPLEPLALRGGGHVVGPPRSLRAAACGEDERERAVEPDRLDELERVTEVALRLAREADDDVRAECEVGYRRAELLH
jgi:hypothetical protein